MEKRGGGISSLELADMSKKINSYYQIFVKFNTVDSMGANFINTYLEKITELFKFYVGEKKFLDDGSEKIDFCDEYFYQIIHLIVLQKPVLIVKSKI